MNPYLQQQVPEESRNLRHQHHYPNESDDASSNRYGESNSRYNNNNNRRNNNNNGHMSYRDGGHHNNHNGNNNNRLTVGGRRNNQSSSNSGSTNGDGRPVAAKRASVELNKVLMDLRAIPEVPFIQWFSILMHIVMFWPKVSNILYIFWGWGKKTSFSMNNHVWNH